MNFGGALLVVGLVLVAAACSSTSVDPVAADQLSTTVSASSSTTTSTMVVTTTTQVNSVNWVPVGGSEYHDSLNHSFDDDADRSSGPLDHAGSRTKALVKGIDEASAFGELHLGAIDRFWAEALDMLDDREDVGIVEELMDRLAADRDSQLADLPPLLSDYAATISAALVARDFESRVAAYEILDEILMVGLDREVFANMIYDLHYVLGSEVTPELTRRAVLASGRIGSEFDPDSLPPLPDRILLVQWSDAFTQADIVVLVGLDGEPIGYLDHHTMMGPNAVTIADGQVLYGVPSHGVSEHPVADCVESFVAADRTYLICDDTTSYKNPAWRAEIRIQYADGSTERIGGAGYAYPDENPSHPVAGHWVEVFPSPDGTAVLGQWSGECEVPSAHMIYDGAVSTGLGNDGELWAESWALGWQDNDAALVAITWGACSSAPHQSGVFTVSKEGRIQPLYSTTTGGVIARLVSPNDPSPIPIVTMPLPASIDYRRYFDGNHAYLIEIGSGAGYLGTKDGDPLVVFACDDSNVYLGPVSADDYDKLVAAAVGFASQHACRATPMAPTECLGVASDPVACSE